MSTGVVVGDVYGPKNLARRPTDWRADYVVPNRGGFVSGIVRVVTGGRGSDVAGESWFTALFFFPCAVSALRLFVHP